MQFFGVENITRLTKSSSTQLYLPGGFTMRAGTRGFSSVLSLYCNSGVSGIGGLDTGSLSWGLYYCYLVYNGTSLGLVLSLSSSAPTGFTIYRLVGGALVNSAYQIDTVFSLDQLSSEAVLNTRNYLRNNSLLKSSDFPDTTGLYGWSLNGQSDANTIQNHVGGVDLTRLGGLGLSTNHLGNPAYNAFDGSSDAVYAPGTTFDTANESFTCGGWFKIDTLRDDQFFAKIGPGAEGFQVYNNNTGVNSLTFDVYYSAGNYLRTSCTTVLNDSKWHHIVAVYNKESTSLMLVVDGKIVSYLFNASLTTRVNSSGSKLSFGSSGNGAVSNPFLGQIGDVFYKKSAMTFTQIRQIYVVGTKLQAYLDFLNKVRINGEVGALGSYSVYPSLSSAGPFTGSFADLANMQSHIAESGKWKITAWAPVFCQGAGGSTISYCLAKNGTSISGTSRQVMNSTAANISTGASTEISHEGSFSYNDRISYQVQSTTGYTDNSIATRSPFIRVELLDY